jgi:hypothetical protein
MVHICPCPIKFPLSKYSPSILNYKGPFELLEFHRKQFVFIEKKCRKQKISRIPKKAYVILVT